MLGHIFLSCFAYTCMVLRFLLLVILIINSWITYSRLVHWRAPSLVLSKIFSFTFSLSSHTYWIINCLRPTSALPYGVEHHLIQMISGSAQSRVQFYLHNHQVQNIYSGGNSELLGSRGKIREGEALSHMLSSSHMSTQRVGYGSRKTTHKRDWLRRITDLHTETSLRLEAH